MSENNGVPVPVIVWIRAHLTALYDPSGNACAVEDAFDRTFTPTCELRLNHEMWPLHALRNDLALRAGVTGMHASVAWDADVVSTNEDRPDEPAIVAGALVVTRFLPFRIRAGPAQRRTHVHFSARVEQDVGVQGGDRRRITSFYYTSVDSTPPTYFAVPRTAQEGVDDQ